MSKDILDFDIGFLADLEDSNRVDKLKIWVEKSIGTLSKKRDEQGTQATDMRPTFELKGQLETMLQIKSVMNLLGLWK
jgi:hypothetical protein